MQYRQAIGHAVGLEIINSDHYAYNRTGGNVTKGMTVVFDYERSQPETTADLEAMGSAGHPLSNVIFMTNTAAGRTLQATGWHAYVMDDLVADNGRVRVQWGGIGYALCQSTDAGNPATAPGSKALTLAPNSFGNLGALQNISANQKVSFIADDAHPGGAAVTTLLRGWIDGLHGHK